MRASLLGSLVLATALGACHVYDEGLVDATVDGRGSDGFAGDHTGDATAPDVVSDAMDAHVNTDTRAETAVGDARDVIAPSDAMDAADTMDARPCTTVCSGTCSDPMTDVHNCGGCGRDCVAMLPGDAGVVDENVACVNGACSLAGACVPSRLDCNGTLSDGCEVDQTLSGNCGACGTTCSDPTPFCVPQTNVDGGLPTVFACASDCASATAANCGGTCVAIMTDVNHCGDCTTVCSTTAANAVAACVGAACSFACSPGYGNCNGVASDGCEQPTGNDPDNCGACNNHCAAAAGSMPGCMAGHCVAVCTSTSLGDCNGIATDGCEADLTGDAMNCGACGHQCPSSTGGTAMCANGMCAVQCGTGYTLQSGTCVLATAPRQIAPMPFSTVTKRRPTFRWLAVAGIDGGHVDVCTDRGCTSIVTSVDVTGGNTSATITTDLPVGRLYWRVRGKVGTADGTVNGPSWPFRVRNAQSLTAPDTSYGSEYDANGDGYDDVIIGAFRAGSTSGRAYYYPGGSSGITASTTAVELSGPVGSFFGRVLNNVGDANADGYADAVISAWQTTNTFFYAGSATGPALSPRQISTPMNSQLFGGTIAPIGDTNGDGYADFVIGDANPNAGATAPADNKVFVYLGSATFGQSMVNGASNPTPYGTPTLLSVTASQFGFAAASAGDVDADTYADLIVGAPGDNSAYVFYGSPTGLPRRDSTGNFPANSTTTLFPSSAGRFGASVAGAGDYNGDGYTDVIVGAPTGNTVYIFPGSGTRINNASPVVVTAPTGAQAFGASVAYIGDANNDGFSDIVVGAPGTGTAGYSPRAYLYLGAMNGLSAPILVSEPAGTPPSGTPRDFGVVVNSAGDTNNDLFDDALIGAPSLDSVVLVRGADSMLLGTQSTITPRASGSTQAFGAALSLRTPSRTRHRFHH